MELGSELQLCCSKSYWYPQDICPYFHQNIQIPKSVLHCMMLEFAASNNAAVNPFTAHFSSRDMAADVTASTVRSNPHRALQQWLYSLYLGICPERYQ